jgi:glycosyltransferase involved in cell wall biosynthesis
MITIAIGVHVRDEPQCLVATLDSIQHKTPQEHELVIIVDGGDAGVRAAATQSAARVVDEETARGGAACFNKLMRNTTAGVVVLLESGCIVGPRWLDHLLAALDRSPRAGLAGPSTNAAWNEQRVFVSAGGSESEVAATAADAERRFASQFRTLGPLYSLADFCYAVKREVFEKIGEADEAYGLGPCWEMDYNIRAARAGFDGLWACASYVWRSPLSQRRQREESAWFERSRHHYQNKFCGARLRGVKKDYRQHCRGDACPNFAPHPDSRIESRDVPLVSCIMPTYNRREFIAQSVACFLAQDYPNLEMIVVDDGSDPIVDLIPKDSRFVYHRVDQRMPVGTKRNFACERARGEIIAHWDDDDWYPASRIRTQAAALLERGADICGTSVLYYYDRARERAFRYQYSSANGWVGGNTLVYRRDYWQGHRFADIQVGEDSRFIWSSSDARIVDLKDPRLCVGALHAGNISPKEIHSSYWSAEPVERVREVIAAGSAPPFPLASCVMPTYGRRAFIPLALECFRRQTYPNRELIVIDDGLDAVGDLFKDERSVRYLHIGKRVSIGAKRNIGCANACGEIVVLWDDDDWYDPRRVERQVTPILRGEADITGLENRLVLQLPEKKWWTVNPQLHRSMFVENVPGGTVAFRRSIWSGGIHFPEISLAEDAAFVQAARQRGSRLLRLDVDTLFVYVRHGANTWRFDPGTFINPGGWSESFAPASFSSETLERYAAAATAMR